MDTIKPTTIIIFGAMGDLAWRKLLPSLLDLYSRGELPSELRIVGASRDALSTEGFIQHVQEKVPGTTSDFIQLLSYVQMDVLTQEGYGHLEAHLAEVENGARGNRLFHLAVPPTLYKGIFNLLGQSGLASESESLWSRVLVEKPFGYDLASAKELNAVISEHLQESQIYRVDHYLAKDSVENIIAFRFSNVLFDHSWDKEHIESVHIKMHERGDVAHRGAFYETVGALRDVGQNHLLQLLALIAMESPGKLDAAEVSNKRLAALSALRTYSKSEVSANTERGQYVGYRDTEGIDELSNTETYFVIRAFVDTPAWQDVPFIIEGGKGMPQDSIEITVKFRGHTECVCGMEDKEHMHGNELTFTIKPQQQVKITLWVKKPGLDYKLDSQELVYDYNAEAQSNMPTAYAQVLRDAVLGNRTIFPSAAEIEASWEFVTPIVEAWAEESFTFYEKGTCPDVAQLSTLYEVVTKDNNQIKSV